MAHLRGADFPAGSFTANAWLPVDFTSTPSTNDLAGADLTRNRFVVPVTGWYTLSATSYSCPQTQHSSSIRINLNGTGAVYANTALAGGCRDVLALETRPLTQGDVITLDVAASANGPNQGISGIMLTVVRLR